MPVSPEPNKELKVAFIHDWFENYGGSEQVAREILKLYPKADVYSLIDFLDEESREMILGKRKIQTSFIQNLPFSRKRFRNYFFLFPLAIEQFDLTDYDVVISSSHAVAKGVLTFSYQTHICYCHSPIRYAWDLYAQYQKQLRSRRWKVRASKLFLHYMRMWDVSAGRRPDHIIANSNFVKYRIKKIYGRNSQVIYPPVDCQKFIPGKGERKEFYLVVSRLVAYKRVDLIMEAFRKMPQKQLIVIGDGPEKKQMMKVAPENVQFLGNADDNLVLRYYQEARAFILAAVEDFGITALEAQATGAPVIALADGGYLETVVEGKTGIFFKRQSVKDILEAVLKFEETEDDFNADLIREHALQFDVSVFSGAFQEYVEDKMSRALSYEE